MPNFPRTDLAVEAEALRSAAAAAQLPGVRAAQTQRRGFAVTQVEVLDAAGSEALCKPIGRYDTLDLTPLLRRADDAFENAAQTLSELLRAALPLMPEASVLVVGLGNRAITPDAVGPDAMQSVLVTRQMRSPARSPTASAAPFSSPTPASRPAAVSATTAPGLTAPRSAYRSRPLDCRRSSTRAASQTTRAPSGCSSRRAISTRSCAMPPSSSATASTSRCTTG